MITSTGNQNIKEVVQLRKKSKARSQAGVFLVEGIRMIQEVPRERLKKLYVTEGFYKKYRNEFDLLNGKSDKGIVPELVSDTVFAYMSDTKTPQGVLGIVEQAEYSLEEIAGGRAAGDAQSGAETAGADGGGEKVRRAAGAPHILILDNLQDPGNLGTIFRTAEAAGVSGIILSRDCVDIYNPKTIRSTMGAVYRMPFLYVDDLPEVIGQLKQRSIQIYAAHLDGKHTYDKEDYRGGTAFLIGNEGNGLRKEVADCADTWIRIPMEGQVESLNAAIAAAVLIFEVSRQRRDNH